MIDEIPERLESTTAILCSAFAAMVRAQATQVDSVLIAEAMRDLASTLKPTQRGMILRQPVLDAIRRLESLAE